MWQPTRLMRAQMAERRLATGRLLRAGGLSQAAVAREVGVSRASVTRWKQQLEQRGLRGLRRHRPAGRASHLTADQWRKLLRLLRRGAVAAGFETERWTQQRIATLIERKFGVRYHFRSLGRGLRARERDEALVEVRLWCNWPRRKRRPLSTPRLRRT